MDDREKVIRRLEYVLDAMVQSEHAIAENGVVMSSWQDRAKRIDAIREAIALLKAQEKATIEPKRIDLDDETKAWLDKMDAVDALGNIADICIDWDGYRTADGLGGLVNEIWAYARYCADRMLKAQEARVITLEEVKSLERDAVVWYEHIGVNKQRPRIVDQVYDSGIIFTDGGHWQFNADAYGKKFRLWTSRPTDAEREAEPWRS